MALLCVLLLAPAQTGAPAVVHVYPKKPGQPLRRDGALNTTFSFAALVTKEEGDRLAVRINKGRSGVETPFFSTRVDGWVDRKDVVRGEAAVEYFTGVLAADAGNAWALINRGMARANRAGVNPDGEEFALTLKDFDRAVELDPASPHGYLARAWVWFAQRKAKEAIKDLSHAIRLKPDLEAAFFLRGSVRHLTGDHPKAIEDLDEAIRLKPDYSDALITRGTARQAMADHDRALADLSAALRIDPTNVFALCQRASVWMAEKEYAATYRDYEQAMRLKPDNPEICRLFAWLMAACPDAEVRNGRRALELARKAAAPPGDKKWRCLHVLAAAHAEAGDFPAAVEVQVKAIKLAEAANAHPQNLQNLRALLNGYRERKPCRELGL